MLGHQDELGYAFTGVVLLVGGDAEPKLYLPRLAAELSRSLGELCEVSPEYL